LAAGAGAELSAAAGVPDFGASAAIEAAARPKVNKAVVIRVADFFMRSPNVVWARADRRIRRNQPFQPR
jgi:NAD-dependent SIR2 family protein deacetylase